MTLPHKQRFSALGTEWSIETARPLPRDLMVQIETRIEAFDTTYSRFRSDSHVARLAKSGGTEQFPDDLAPLMRLYQSLYELTEGAVTPLIGDALVAAGYDAQYSLRPGGQVDTPRWEAVLAWHDSELTVRQPVTLDFGAAGKGYLVDIVAELLEQAGIKEYVVDASGDLRHRGVSSDRVGLEHPDDATRVIGVVEVANRSLCASATNRRAWGPGLHHVFDPRTQSPVRDVAATWVMADTALVADGLATALFFVPPDRLVATYAFEYVRLHSDGSLDYSANFSGELFT